MTFDERELAEFLKTRPKKPAPLRFGCPDEFELLAFAEGRGAGSDREAIENHLADCAPCLEELDVLVKARRISMDDPIPATLLSRARHLGEAPARPKSTTIWQWRALVAVAASVLVIATLGIYLQRTGKLTKLQPSSTPTSSSNPANASGGVRNDTSESSQLTVLSPQPNALVDRKRVEFQWTPVKGALFYEVRVATDDGEPVWNQKTEKASIGLPIGIDLKIGNKYFLSFSAFMEGGGTLRSKAVPFTVSEGK